MCLAAHVCSPGYQDWFHESCLNLRERPSERPLSPEEHADADDDASSASSDLPPALLTADDYDALICGACVRRIPILRRCAGTPGVLMVVRDASEQPWRVIGKEENIQDSVTVDVAEEAKPPEADVGGKRARSPEDTEIPTAKRPRVSTDPPRFPPCLAPSENPIAQKVVSSTSEQTTNGDADQSATTSEPSSVGGDVFLTEGWRERWCQCQSVRSPTHDPLNRH